MEVSDKRSADALVCEEVSEKRSADALICEEVSDKRSADALICEEVSDKRSACQRLPHKSEHRYTTVQNACQETFSQIIASLQYRAERLSRDFLTNQSIVTLPCRTLVKRLSHKHSIVTLPCRTLVKRLSHKSEHRYTTVQNACQETSSQIRASLHYRAERLSRDFLTNQSIVTLPCRTLVKGLSHKSEHRYTTVQNACQRLPHKSEHRYTTVLSACQETSSQISA